MSCVHELVSGIMRAGGTGCGRRWVMCVQAKGVTRNALTDFTDHALTFSEGFFISKWDGPEA